MSVLCRHRDVWIRPNARRRETPQFPRGGDDDVAGHRWDGGNGRFKNKGDDGDLLKKLKEEIQTLVCLETNVIFCFTGSKSTNSFLNCFYCKKYYPSIHSGHQICREEIKPVAKLVSSAASQSSQRSNLPHRSKETIKSLTFTSLSCCCHGYHPVLE